MHLSVPDARELAARGTAYVGYDIHINGVFHCTVRYKQLHSLHAQLQQHFSDMKLPDFPPKKILPLTNSQVEERRLLLERYLQLVGQNTTLSNSDFLIGFLASAQQEMYNEARHEVPMDIYLMNGFRIPLNISSTDSSNKVLERACLNLHLPIDFVKYFALYLADIDDVTNEITIYKKLEDFESPYISQKAFNVNHKIYIRKSYWDVSYDEMVMTNHIAVDLLFIQTVAEVMAGWISAPLTVLNRLQQYQTNNQKAEYMDLARAQRHYGYVLAGQGHAEWTSGGVAKGRAKVLLGNSGLMLITTDHQEVFFKVVRMKCWRITTLRPNDTLRDIQNGHFRNETSHNNSEDSKLELSYEYLMNKDSLQWVTILSDRAMFMSVCLQSIVDELMGQKLFNKPNTYSNSSHHSGITKQNSLTYLRRDGTSQILSPSSSADILNSKTVDAKSAAAKFSIKKLSEKFASVSFRSGHDYVENNAFGGIGDEDL